MVEVFEAGELDGQMIVFQDDCKKLGLDGGESPASHSGGSVQDGEPELDSDVDVDPDRVARTPALLTLGIVDTQPYVSNQFYTFNSASHHLMVVCILENRYANADEIRSATPGNVLVSWKGVWKDRNEDTAYLTGWKRIQDKLQALVDEHGNEMLYFKNNPQQFVPHIDQWQDIVQGFHRDADLKHLGMKETIERIKQVWTVGAKFYGIPESFIRVCVSSCPVCCSDSSSNHARSKRRHFEYTESLEVQAKDVPLRLQQLAAKHQVVLCIRQKYIRFKPFLAEVKDYCCHRAGEPNTKKAGILKRKKYSSKRCGCGFRIRAIVPIANYSEKEKTFTYQEEGKAIFKLYAIHSGHKPGPHEGSARIIHRFVGPASMKLDLTPVLDSVQDDSLQDAAKDDAGGIREATLQQVNELRLELDTLRNNLGSLSHEVLNDISQSLADVIQRLRRVDELYKSAGFFVINEREDERLISDPRLGGDWRGSHGDDKHDNDLIVQNEEFNSDMEPSSEWQIQRPQRLSKDEVLQDKRAKWFDTVKESSIACDDKNILDEEHRNSNEEVVVSGAGNVPLVSMPVDNYYQENVKWYEGMSCGLDPTGDCGDDLSHSVQSGFRHAIV
eukprot:c26325_g1_i1 orf=170-2011(-)